MRSRARAWLLLALFLGAGTSMPSADALLYHIHPDPWAGRVHVEPIGGCTAHADHCTLGRTPPGSRALASLALSVQSVRDSRPTDVPRPAPTPRAATAGLLPPSRAPPVPQI